MEEYGMQTICAGMAKMEIEPAEFAEHVGEIVVIHGSIYKIRRMSGFCFVILRTARHTVQCVCDRTELMGDLAEEACVRLTAEIVREERAKLGAELHLRKVEYLSRPAAQMPVVVNQKLVDTSLEKKLDYRPLTLRNEKERAVFRIQEGILRGFRRFFEEEHFVEIHTPKIVYAGAEGGADIFRLDYFGREAYLAQSPQFYKQMMTGVFERVYETGPVFRAEKHDTARHLNEYTGVDFEMGYIESFRDIMAMEVKMLASALELLQEEYGYELALLGVELPRMLETEQPGMPGAEQSYMPGTEPPHMPGTGGMVKARLAVPVLKFAQAKRMVAETYHRQPRECHDFEPEEEKLLSELVLRRYGSDFVFVTHYPEEKRPFYVMEDPENPGETFSFDLIFRGLEITTGGQRIHDYEMQVAKMKKRGMDPQAFESYLMMHRHGMPPHGGLGLGLERFTARLLGYENVRQASLFPRDIHRLTP